MITEKDILAIQHAMVGDTYLMATRTADDNGLPATPENPIIIEREECPYCGSTTLKHGTSTYSRNTGGWGWCTSAGWK